MILFKDIGQLLTLQGAAKKDGRKVSEKDLSLIKNACIVCQGKKIEWFGSQKKLPGSLAKKIKKEVSLFGKTVLPAFTECHTHLVFSGQRANEFELRNQGVSYAEISRRGGGILSTVKESRKSSFEELLSLAQKRVDHFVRQGVTTLEVKSGYGLRLKDEMKMLRVVQSLKKARVLSTYLGPHSVPREFSDSESYIQRIIKKDLRHIKQEKLADRVDIFIEKGFFSKEQGRRYLQAAKELGFQITIHAEQLNATGAGQLGVDLDAVSVDHLVEFKSDDIKKIARSQTAAVLLPAADFYLEMKYPPARKLIDAGAIVALATDFNPGSSPTQDLAFTGLLARMKMKMTLPEVIVAYTLNSAKALGLSHQQGSIEVGKNCDFIALDQDWSELFYHVGDNGISEVWKEGRQLFRSR